MVRGVGCMGVRGVGVVGVEVVWVWVVYGVCRVGVGMG